MQSAKLSISHIQVSAYLQPTLPLKQHPEAFTVRKNVMEILFCQTKASHSWQDWKDPVAPVGIFVHTLFLPVEELQNTDMSHKTQVA